MMKKLLSLLILSAILLSCTFGLFESKCYAANLNPPQGKTPSGIPLNKMEEKIDQYLSKYIGKTSPGASVAVVKNGEIIFLKGYGYADIESQTPVDPYNTIFEWGSTTKLFTWTSIMQLVEDGKIDLDTNIKEYLPKDFFEKLECDQAITIRDIMNHSAGFGDYAFNTIVFSPDDLVSLEEAILRDKPKQYYKVGTASAYSNYAASLAGYIVENISEQPYEQYVKDHIFDVLSMNMTSAYPRIDYNKNIIKNKAKGYLSDQKGGFKLGNWSYVSHLPAGSINGTAEDFAKYAIALMPERDKKTPLFKNTSTLNNMLSPSYNMNNEMVGTAHGFFEYAGEYPTLGHGGNTASFSSQFTIVPQESFGIVVLTNANLEMDIIFGLQDLLMGKKYNQIQINNQDFPSSNEVAGLYVPMSRQEGNFLDFAKYISLYKVEAVDQNKIKMCLGIYNGTYIQTAPYYYELVEDNIPLFRNAYPVLRFKSDNGSIEQIIVGHGLDLSELPSGRTTPFLIGSVIVLLINIIFFLLAPIILILIVIKNKKGALTLDNKRFNFYHLMLVLCGTITIINNIIPTAKIMVNNFRTFAEMKPHILLNYPLLVITIMMGILAAYSFKKITISKKQKLFYSITIILLILLYSLLIHWNYFAIVG